MASTIHTYAIKTKEIVFILELQEHLSQSIVLIAICEHNFPVWRSITGHTVRGRNVAGVPESMVKHVEKFGFTHAFLSHVLY